MKLELTKQTRDKMEQHAGEYYPNECCGFFYGSDRGETRRVSVVRQVNNAKEGDQSNRFRIDPKDYQKAEKYALDNDLDLLGVYHSHPDHPAVPSEHDRKVALPYFSYIIISVREGEAVDIRSWRLNEERQFDEETVRTKTVSERQKTS